MIDVKAARRLADTPPSAAQVLARSEQDAPLSMRWPGLLLAIMATAIAYVQSLVSRSEAATSSDEQRRSEAAEEAAAALAEDAPGATNPPAQAEAEPDETGSLRRDGNDPLGSGQAGPAVPGIADFMGIDSPAIDYEQLPLPASLPLKRPPDFEQGASNDNGGLFATGVAGGSLTPGSGLSAGSDLAGGRSAWSGSASAGIGETVIVAAFPLPFRPLEPIAQPEPAPVDPDDRTPDPPFPDRNRAPRVSGALRLADVGPCQASLLTALMLLAGASDADGDVLAPRNLTVSHGTLTQTAEGWLYRPQPGYFGEITLGYEISDGQDFVSQSASFEVVEFLRLIGTPQDDVLIGSDCQDLIEGREGNDVIEGRGGRDIILAGDGNDLIYGGAGDDTIIAGAGNDIVFGGSGNDIIRGGTGNDRLHGEDGDDEIFGEDGDDWLTGGAGNDRLDGGDGNDRLDGGAGDDLLIGGAGDDEIVGGDGNDTILSGEGADIVEGGDGDDDIDAGGGRNTVFGGNGNDRLVGGADDDMLDGGAGNDELVGAAGRDRLVGGDGNDLIDAGADDDSVSGGADDDLILAGDGDDTVDAGTGHDVVMAGAGNDVVAGGAGHDTLLGEAGDDCLDGGEGDDRLLGGAGDDELHGSGGDDQLAGGAGRDKVYGGSGNDMVVVDADCATDVYDGGSGRDTLDLSTLRTGTVVDLVKGEIKSSEAGNDTVKNFEVVIGGAGHDTFVIGTNTASTVSGGSGRDTFKYELQGDGAEADAEDLIHRILDLEAGDRIIVSQYTIRQDDDRDGDEQVDRDDFARIYGDDADEDRPFRFRIEKIGEHDTTFIDVEIENEGGRDFSIEISGAHRFYYYS